MSIRVLIADTQYLIRLGLKGLLSKSPNIQLVGEAMDGDELVLKVKSLHPDVVIIDYNQPHFFSIEDMASVKKAIPGTRFLVISSDENRENIFKAIESGAISFLTKSCDEEEILNAIQATAKGEKFMCHKVIDIILDKHISPKEEDCKPFNLSLREIEIIQHTAQGLPAKEIAQRLYLSTHTVYTHRKNIMKKLQLNSSSEIILYAIRNGLVSTEELV